MDNIRIVELTRRQVKMVYSDCMSEHFPPEEIKPLKIILKALDKGHYKCLGILDNNTIIGYGFFIKNNNDFLLDYFAVEKEIRNRGVGAFFLGYIKEYFCNADSVICEVENPEYAFVPELKSIRERRYEFYKRNGFLDTKVRTKLFGVDYIVLELDLGKAHTDEQIKTIYRKHYKAILPKTLYKANLLIE